MVISETSSNSPLIKTLVTSLKSALFAHLAEVFRLFHTYCMSPPLPLSFLFLLILRLLKDGLSSFGLRALLLSLYYPFQFSVQDKDRVGKRSLWESPDVTQMVVCAHGWCHTQAATHESTTRVVS